MGKRNKKKTLRFPIEVNAFEPPSSTRSGRTFSAPTPVAPPPDINSSQFPNLNAKPNSNPMEANLSTALAIPSPNLEPFALVFESANADLLASPVPFSGLAHQFPDISSGSLCGGEYSDLVLDIDGIESMLPLSGIADASALSLGSMLPRLVCGDANCTQVSAVLPIHAVSDYVHGPNCIPPSSMPKNPTVKNTKIFHNGNASLNHNVCPVMNPIAPHACSHRPSPSPNVTVNGASPMPNHNSTSPITSTEKPWSSLFTTKPRNAGVYSPRQFDISCVDGVMIPPPEVIEAGTQFWKDHLVGFFLGENPTYSVVRSHLRRRWKLKGRITMKYDNSLFFFEFSCPDDRQRILEAEPLIIDGNPFIVTPWSPSVDSAREQVLSIPVWVHFKKIPSVLQSLIGIDWLANLVGNLICFDEATVKRDRLVYAKALIEVKPDKLLPSFLPVAPAKNRVAIVDVDYSWMPLICTSCHSFGHSAVSCLHPPATPVPDPVLKQNITIPLPVKIPLPRPRRRIWVPKQPVVPDVCQVDVSMASHEKATVDVMKPVPVFEPMQDCPELSVDASVSSSSVDGPISWNCGEHVWEHEISGMRYSPTKDYFYKFVTDDEGETRSLYYSISEDTLVLASAGDLMEENRVVLDDGSWDRGFIFSAGSVGFVPNIVGLFAEFFHVIGDDTSSVCSSSEDA